MTIGMDVREPVAEDVLGFLTQMEFRTLSARIAGKLGVEAPVIAEPEVADAPPATAAVGFDSQKYECVRDAAALQVWIDRIYQHGWVAVDTARTCEKRRLRTLMNPLTKQSIALFDSVKNPALHTISTRSAVIRFWNSLNDRNTTIL